MNPYQKLSKAQMDDWTDAFLACDYYDKPIANIDYPVFRRTYKKSLNKTAAGKPIYVAPHELINILTHKIEGASPEDVFQCMDFVFNADGESRVTLSTIEYIYKLYNSYKIDYWLERQKEPYIGQFRMNFKYPVEKYLMKQPQPSFLIKYVDGGIIVRRSANDKIVLQVSTGNAELDELIVEDVMTHIE